VQFASFLVSRLLAVFALFFINQSVAILRFGGPTAFVPYLLRAVEAPFTQALIEEGAKGVAIRHISITAFAAFPCPLPPVEEQHEIVRRVDALFTLADKTEARAVSATARVEKITQAILAKAFRGELVPTEAELARQEGRSYESASALLERIRAEREALEPLDGERRKSKQGRNAKRKSRGEP
jgi:type I restriction enzyme S subunit